ncbi:Heterogeneous nuclear ribonucleoprotein Q [Camelus dromedarius]|uniref:Heterogeneous nuclear ribonucleoprotein Q n=1 Tax=Camelus dromedarius TaxID=9838 RepID=A0A5N4DW55_CAMDR|nr:Heterogeneous nuclear ribonucleoprotein Q [Camelus dromedarius]
MLGADPSLILLIAFEQISGNMATEHVNGNGTEEPMDTTSAVIHSENFQTLLDAGLPQKVAEKLDEIYVAGLVAHSDLDERAIEALKEFNEDGALAVLQQFKDSDLSHVQNKSAFLCGVMKTYRQREKQGTKVADSSKGPDEAKIKALLERTGYTLDVTTGQRKYGGPPPDSVYSGQQPSVGTEIFVGKIPRDLFEDELVPLFEKAGPIWDLRLMMDPLTGLNRGYAFVTFCTKEAAQEAVKLYNNHEIRSGKHIGVCISVANNRLFVGSIPKSKTKEQILEEFSKVTEGLTDVILYHQPDDKKKNRGFCFLEYEDHKTAAQARRRLMSGKVKVWGNVGTVEWADPIEDPDPEVMAKVKVLFVRNLANTVTEEILEKAFSQFGKLERVKKLKDYAFIHFDERDGAVKAMEEMNGKDLEGENIEIVFAKPPDQKRKERKAQRQAAKNQMKQSIRGNGIQNDKFDSMMITTIMVHLICPLQQEVEGVEVEVVMDILQIIMDMKIIMIIMAMITITIVVDMKIHTMVMKIFKLELEEGVVEEQGVLLLPEVAGLLLPVVEPVIHREEVLDQQEAFVVREEVPNNKEAAGYVVRGVAAVEM